MLARLCAAARPLARPTALAVRTPLVAVQSRSMAMGPASGGEVSDELLEKLVRPKDARALPTRLPLSSLLSLPLSSLSQRASLSLPPLFLPTRLSLA